MSALGNRIPDVAIVGAGIVGAACADACAADGLSVDVFEAAFEGGGVTACAMGHIVVMDDSDAQFALTAYSRRLWDEIISELPTSVADEQRGTLWIAADDDELEHVERKAALYRAKGVAADVLGAADTAREEPNLRGGLAGALLVPGDRVLYPPAAARFLLERASSRGARVHRGVDVLAIDEGRLRTARAVLDAGIIVNAAGIGATKLTAALPIEPRKGHLVVTDSYPGFCNHQLVELGYLKSAHAPARESVAFNVQPRATGQILLGSSREFVGLDATINRSLVDRMLRRAIEFMPALARVSALRTWIGFRPCTPDNLPIIGPVSGQAESSRRTFVAAGHEGLGVTTALGTGRLVADLVAGRSPAIDPEPYSHARFDGAADG